MSSTVVFESQFYRFFWGKEKCVGSFFYQFIVSQDRSEVAETSACDVPTTPSPFCHVERRNVKSPTKLDHVCHLFFKNAQIRFKVNFNVYRNGGNLICKQKKCIRDALLWYSSCTDGAPISITCGKI